MVICTRPSTFDLNRELTFAVTNAFSVTVSRDEFITTCDTFVTYVTFAFRFFDTFFANLDFIFFTFDWWLFLVFTLTNHVAAGGRPIKRWEMKTSLRVVRVVSFVRSFGINRWQCCWI